MSRPSLTNHVMDAATANGQPFISLTSNGTPAMTEIRLSDGRSLGLVQSATWSLDVTSYASCCVETMASPAELKAFLKDTTLRVRPAAGYNPLRYLWDWSCAWVYNAFTRP